jgi:hypothetical protein
MRKTSIYSVPSGPNGQFRQAGAIPHRPPQNLQALDNSHERQRMTNPPEVRWPRGPKPVENVAAKDEIIEPEAIFPGSEEQPRSSSTVRTAFEQKPRLILPFCPPGGMELLYVQCGINGFNDPHRHLHSQTLFDLARPTFAREGMTGMDFGQFRLSRRSIAIAVALISLVPLALGAHAALNKRSFEATPSDAAGQSNASASNRVALVIGNGRYPDAAEQLAQPINDARALTGALRRDGFDVEVVEDATRDDLLQAVERLQARVRPDSVVLLFFGGFGIQAGRDSYMIPVDAAIWREADVRRHGVSVEQVLAQVEQRGGRAKLAVLDASRRNPYERRFRGYSHGLAPIQAPDNALVLSAASPGKVADDVAAQNSVLVTELLKAIAEPGSAEAAFGKARNAVAQLSEGAQVPALSSSLHDVVEFGKTEAATAEKTGG